MSALKNKRLSPQEEKRRARQRSGQGGPENDKRTAAAYQLGIEAARDVIAPILARRYWWRGFRAGSVVGAVSASAGWWAYAAWVSTVW